MEKTDQDSLSQVIKGFSRLRLRQNIQEGAEIMEETNVRFLLLLLYVDMLRSRLHFPNTAHPRLLRKASDEFH